MTEKPLKDTRLDDMLSAINRGVTLIDFNAAWCVPCGKLRPIVQRLEQTYREQMQVLDLDVDVHPGLAMKLGITSIPTLVLYKNGEEIHRFIGLQTEETLIRSLEKALHR